MHFQEPDWAALGNSEKTAATSTGPVSVYNEWGRLREVIVGRITDARIPDWHPQIEAILPPDQIQLFRKEAGKPFPPAELMAATYELENFVGFLESEGVVVRRPDEGCVIPAFTTPYFSTSGGFYSAMPRDCMLAIGTTIIEAPMSWRNRYFETFPFRPILQDYFERGAKWLAGPKPMLSESSYVTPKEAATGFALAETEPLFDAADFLRFGRDIIGQLSNTTNSLGARWLQSVLEPNYRVHIYRFDEPAPMHIDTTIVPLKPGVILINPEWVSRVPSIFQDWQILTAPRPSAGRSTPLYLTSEWISINTLMLDERTVIVEKEEEPLIEMFQKWGFKPVPLPFKHFQSFGGSFHCATLDVRRDGELESFF
jgi:glycine amidinotransferase